MTFTTQPSPRAAIDGGWATAAVRASSRGAVPPVGRTSTLERGQSPHRAASVSLAGRQTGYLTGVSLSSVLQMLHLERKTCIVEVNRGPEFGTLTLVNGELVDAEIGDLSGERAAYHLLSWESPQLMILDGAILFRHSVRESLSHLLLEAVRRTDETDSPAALESDPSMLLCSEIDVHDWAWLVETLVISGASLAAVVSIEQGVVLASSAEPGDGDGTELAVAPTLAEATRLLPGAVSEAIYTIEGEAVLVCPVDETSETWVVAYCAEVGSLDLLRCAVRTLARTRL